jgi:hypothetical protein
LRNALNANVIINRKEEETEIYLTAAGDKETIKTAILDIYSKINNATPYTLVSHG